MADLDDQLRAYADQVEAVVGPTPAMADPTGRSRPWLGWVAALLLVGGIGVAIGFALDEDDPAVPDTQVNPPSTTAPSTTVPTTTVPTTTMPTTTMPTTTVPTTTMPELVVVPDVTGLPLQGAIDLLIELGLVIDVALEEPSSEQVGTIARTEPVAGALVPPRSGVELFMSSGVPVVPVPTVVGLFADTALATLRNVGLAPVTEFRTVPFGDPRVGLVIEQSPDQFVMVAVDSEVVVVVGEAGPEPGD